MLPARERSFLMNDGPPNPPKKRQRTTVGSSGAGNIIDVVDLTNSQSPPAVSTSTITLDSADTSMRGNDIIHKSANSGLKGRKRFVKDLQDVLSVSGKGLFGFRLGITKSDGSADDSGFTLSLTLPASTTMAPGSNEINKPQAIELTFLVSEMADYPSEHTFFTYFESEPPTSATIKQLQEAIAERSGRTIQEEVVLFAYETAKALGIEHLPRTPWPSSSNKHDSGAARRDSDEDEDLDEDDDGSAYDPFDGYTTEEDGDVLSAFPTSRPHSALDKGCLRKHFLEIASESFRPGIVTFGGDDFLLTVSIPFTQLTSPTSTRSPNVLNIPAQALMAWDRRLLNHPYHLCLLIGGGLGKYPYDVMNPSRSSHNNLTFKVGLVKGAYKPTKRHAREATRNFALVGQQHVEHVMRPKLSLSVEEDDEDDEPGRSEAEKEEEKEVEDGAFERFALSNSLETLMDQKFLRILQLRCTHGLTWGGAEKLYEIMEQNQVNDSTALGNWRQEVVVADDFEHSRAGSMPPDPLVGRSPSTSSTNALESFNLPLIAFCYVLRRLIFCTEYCVVCHCPLGLEFEVLKPYVCAKDLCRFQYYVMDAGPSLEYEILHNPSTVDLLVSLAYTSAAEQVMEDPWPTGMALRVSWTFVTNACTLFPGNVHNLHTRWSKTPPESESVTSPLIDHQGRVEFDKLGKPQMRAVIASLIDKLPPIRDMKKHLESPVDPGQARLKLKDMQYGSIPAESWLILRWCVASCTAYLEEIKDHSERIGGLAAWRQFRFTVGAPDAEAKFKHEFDAARSVTAYPSTFAFHGSPLRNWHSIIRHGLWAKTIAHGRAFGDGVYLAKEGLTSISGYAGGASKSWRNSTIGPLSCTALAEIINLPSRYVSNNPHIVIKDTHWIMCRYLLVKGTFLPDGQTPSEGTLPVTLSSAAQSASSFLSKTKKYILSNGAPPTLPKMFVFDPAQRITMSSKPLEIPIPSYRVDQLVTTMETRFVFPEVTQEDTEIFEWKDEPSNQAKKTNGKGNSQGTDATRVIEVSSDEEDSSMDVDDLPLSIKSARQPTTSQGGSLSSFFKAKVKPSDDWRHDPQWVQTCTENLLAPPVVATPSATSALQRELRSMMKEQEAANSLKELGWHMPEGFIGDNLFQWIVEMHSFDATLPIAQDMKKRKINSIVFEIRFPPNFPMSPPFFMIKGPRFLPFIQGGGGHVTGGGSICMDLLTSDGWLPSYSLPAVLIQIKLAISNPDPRPARLASDWSRLYSVYEALEGFKRAAAAHGWQVPPGLDKLIR